MTSSHPPAQIPDAPAFLDVVNNTAHALLPGVCGNDPVSMQAAMRQLHDQLIARTGAARRSAVSWRRVFGRSDGHRALDALYPPGLSQTRLTVDARRQLLTYLDMFPDQCVLIIASCEVDPTIARLPGSPAPIALAAFRDNATVEGVLQ